MSTSISHIVAVVAVIALAGPAAAQDAFVPPVAPAPPASLAPPAPPAVALFALRQARPLPRPGPGPRGPQPRGPETNETVTRTIRIGGNGMLDLENLAGTVVITGGGGNDVVIEATKRAFGATEEQRRARLQEVGISIVERGSRIEVETEYPRNSRNVNVIVDYRVTVPQNTAVTVETVSGDVRASNLRGRVDLESVSGNVEAQNIRGGAVELSSVSGNLTFGDVEVAVASAETVSGNITFGGELQRNGRYEMSSHSGNLRLQIAENGGFTVEANTFSGDIQSDFPVTLGGAARDGARRRGPGSAIRGTFGDGSARLELRTFSGNVVITRR